MDEIKNKKIFFTHKGLGDALMLAGAMENIYKITGEKQIVFTSEENKSLFYNNPHIELINENIKDRNIEKKIKHLKNKGFDLVFLDYYEVKKRDNGNINVKFIDNMPIISNFVLQAGYIGDVELKPVVYLTEEEKKFGKFFQNNQIAIISGGLSKYKRYSYEKYQEIVNKLNKKYNFVQIGLLNNRKLDGVLDCRGKFSIREVASIIYNSDLFVGEIGGLMHLARAVDTRSVIAYSRHEPYCLCSYIANKNILSKYDCDLCLKNKVFPYIYILDEKYGCPNDFLCMKDIDVKDMIYAIDSLMSEKDKNKDLKNLETKRIILEKNGSQNIANIKSYFNSFDHINTTIIKIYLFSRILFLSIHNFKNIKIKYKLFNLFTFLKIKNKKTIKKYYILNLFPLFCFENGYFKFLNFLPILKIKN